MARQNFFFFGPLLKKFAHHWYSLLLLGYKPVQHVTVLNTAGNCNTVGNIIILYYNLMGPPSYMRSVVDRNVDMRRMAAPSLDQGISFTSKMRYGFTVHD